VTVKVAGSTIGVLREHLLVNTGSFGNNVTDDWPELSRVDKTPAKLSHTRDATTYPTNPVEDGWEIRIRGGARTTNRSGFLT
jgi:hypothetical protein